MPSRIHYSGYAKVLRLLWEGGCTPSHVTAATGLQRHWAYKLLRCFAAAKMAHRAGWDFPGKSAKQREPIYVFGPGVDVPWPGGDYYAKPVRLPGAFIAFVCAVRELMSGEHNGTSLQIALGVTGKSALRAVRALKEQRLVHIASFCELPHGGFGPPLYAWGPDEPDQRKPKARPMKELWEKHNRARSERTRQTRLMRALAMGCTPDNRNPKHRELMASRAHQATHAE